MILLLGGTSETRAIATALAGAGLDVLVSTATDEALDIGSHPQIARRSGRLDQAAMAELARSLKVTAIVDAAHPYAAALHATARAAAAELKIPYVAFIRPGGVEPGEGVHFADSHEQAAAIAVSFGRPILLTTGANNLRPYVEAARRASLALTVRVLDRPESIGACRAAGIADEQILAGRGPFSVEANREHIRRAGAGVLVTKDSGESGGVEEKLQAARLEGCQVVVVCRPFAAPADACRTVVEILAAVRRSSEF